MLIRSLAVLILILSFKNVLFAQAPATVSSDSGIPTMQRFFLEGDLLWTRPHLSGNKQPNNFEETFAPQLTFGWNLAEAQAFFLSYRYMKAETEESSDSDIPDLASSMQREFKLQAVDLMYRERMGGPDAPFGLDFDLGSRFAWAKFIDRHTTSMMIGPSSFREESDFFAVGPRIGLKPYWTFDNSSWRMTLYAQGNASFLWSNFKNKAWVNDPLVDPLGYERLVYSAAPNGFLWNFDGEAGFSMFVPGLEGILQLTAGYRYELWNSSKMGFITESGSGTLTNHGPFLRLQISF